MFLFNIEGTKARTVIKPNWDYNDIEDKLGNSNLNRHDSNAISIEIEPWDLNVLYFK